MILYYDTVTYDMTMTLLIINKLQVRSQEPINYHGDTIKFIYVEIDFGAIFPSGEGFIATAALCREHHRHWSAQCTPPGRQGQGARLSVATRHERPSLTAQTTIAQLVGINTARNTLAKSWRSKCRKRVWPYMLWL